MVDVQIKVEILINDRYKAMVKMNFIINVEAKFKSI